MNEPPDLKSEIKKSAISETVKTVIRLALLLVSVLAVAVFPPLRDHIWPVTPKWLLAVLLIISLSVILSLVPYVLHLRRKVQSVRVSSDAENEIVRTTLLAELGALKAELETIKAKPVYPYKFGVKWDDELNPRCPRREAHLAAPHYVLMNNGPDLSFFDCRECGRNIPVTAEGGATPIRFADAKRKMVEAAMERGEIAP